MKKYYKYIWLFLLNYLVQGDIIAQSSDATSKIIRSEILTSIFKLSEQKGVELLQMPQSDNQRLTEIIWLEKKNIQLKEQTVLSLRYRLKSIEEPLFYELSFNLYDDQGNLIEPAVWRKNGDFGIVDYNKEQYEFNINDFFESGFYYGQTYRLEVACQLNGIGFSCNTPRPTFDWSFKKRWYYYVPMGIGTAAAITGGINRKSYKSDYDQYIQLWNEGHIEGEAKPFYQDAIKKQDRNNNLIYIGAGAVIISSLGLLFRYWKGHLPKLRMYDKYCKRKEQQKVGVEIRPATEGIGIALQF